MEDIKTLLYFGAGFHRFSKVVEVIDDEDVDLAVFVDALPKVPHHTPQQNGYKYSKDDISFTRKIRKELKKFGYKMVSSKKDVMVLKRGYKTIVYLYNHTSLESASCDVEIDGFVISDIINRAKLMYLQGYDPFKQFDENEALNSKHLPSICEICGYDIKSDTLEYIESNFPDAHIWGLNDDSDFNAE